MAKILLVEDDTQTYQMMMRRLEQRGYDVSLATDGKGAVARAESESPDLILMDIRLPIQDGYQATRQIRNFSESGSVPIIALTAHATTENRERALAAGCDDYHAKPVAFSQLIRQIEALLD